LFLEVVAHPLLDVLGLPYVDDVSFLIFVEVAAGEVGEGFEIDHGFNASIENADKDKLDCLWYILYMILLKLEANQSTIDHTEPLDLLTKKLLGLEQERSRTGGGCIGSSAFDSWREKGSYKMQELKDDQCFKIASVI
jgi:hypothetical protein